MPTRDEVHALLDDGHSYETAARELGIPAGQAFMIATGLPADGSATPPPEAAGAARPGGASGRARGEPALPGSSQRLVGAPVFNPTRNQRVIDWVRERAARELTRPS